MTTIRYHIGGDSFEVEFEGTATGATVAATAVLAQTSVLALDTRAGEVAVFRAGDVTLAVVVPDLPPPATFFSGDGEAGSGFAGGSLSDYD